MSADVALRFDLRARSICLSVSDIDSRSRHPRRGLPGLRALDRNFDRLPERLRWRVERIVHDPDSGAAEKPVPSPEARERLAELFAPDVERLEQIAGRRFGWLGSA